MKRNLLALGGILFSLGSFSKPPMARLQPCAGDLHPLPAAIVSTEGKQSLTLSVLTYNVEGLPWPARFDRGPQLREIARELSEMREAGTAPDIVLLQEAFSTEATLIGERAGYRNVISGPDVRTKSLPAPEHLSRLLAADRSFLKGEIFPKLVSSGLYILSDYPILETYRRAFPSADCAGFDCLATKGMMLSRVWIPGIPTPVDVFTTHLNSRAPGVPRNRTLAAHRVQTGAMTKFVAVVRDPTHPLIYGGDFNMRHSPERFQNFTLARDYEMVERYCVVNRSTCDVRLAWAGHAPWLDTQDLQGFDDGEQVQVRPIEVDALFDQPWRGAQLSDHDGYLVKYRLSWPEHLAVNPILPRICIKHGSDVI